MALIEDFTEVNKDRPKVHKPTHAGHFSFIGPGDKRYFVVETYGSEDRQFPDKLSQSIQLDEKGAAHLIRLLRTAFPNLQ